jgi:hypothetical protein
MSIWPLVKTGCLSWLYSKIVGGMMFAGFPSLDALQCLGNDDGTATLPLLSASATDLDPPFISTCGRLERGNRNVYL